MAPRILWNGWPDDADLIDLVRHAQLGAPMALDALLAALRPTFLRFFARRLDADDAEDLAQEALTRMTHALPLIDPTRAGRYVTRVGRNLLHTHYKRVARDPSRPAPPTFFDTLESSATPDGVLEHRELIAAVRRASRDGLPTPFQPIVDGLLRGLNPIEIAAEAGVHPTTIRTRLHRVRRHLRRHLGYGSDGDRGKVSGDA